MKSAKQRRIELKAHKKARKTKLANKRTEAEKLAKSKWAASHGGVIVDLNSLAPKDIIYRSHLTWHGLRTGAM